MGEFDVSNLVPEKSLISRQYLETQKELHERPEGYGGKGKKWAPTVVELIQQYGATSVLDYGCGRGSLVRKLRELELPGVRLAEYDPAIKGKNRYPSFADLVVCTDVIEHVEPAKLARVLAHLKTLTRKAAFVVISTRDSNKTLIDGRNAHLIVESGDWWSARLQEAGFVVKPPPEIKYSKPAREFAAVLELSPC